MQFRYMAVFTCPDLLLAAYMLWGGVRLALSGGGPALPSLTRWLVLLSLYAASRRVPDKQWLWRLLLGAGVVQGLCAVGQSLGYVSGNHTLFAVTGFLGNPGPLGGFQAVAFTAGCLLLIAAERRSHRLWLTAALAVVGCSLVLSDSRAGWVSAAVGAVVVWWPSVRGRLGRSRGLRWATAGVVLLAAAGLFAYRSDSVRARLLVWRVTTEMAADRLWTGYGSGGFNREYMLYQARYFAEHPDSPSADVADNAAYPYNEFLRLLVEQGVVGLALFTALIVATFRSAVDRRQTAPLAALLIFACFSYPSYVWGMLVLFPLVWGAVVCRPVLRFPARYGRIARGVLWTATLVVVVHGALVGREVRHSRRILARGYDASAAACVTAHFDRFAGDPFYGFAYLDLALRYPQMADTAKLSRVVPTCETWCALGDYHAAAGSLARAESYYRTAARMIPTRLTPNYRLWLLLRAGNRTAEARELGRRMLRQRLKVESTFTLRAKGEVRRWLDAQVGSGLSGPECVVSRESRKT